MMYFLINWLYSKCLLLVIPLRTNLIDLYFAFGRAVITNECFKPWWGLWLVCCVRYLILEFNFLRNLRNIDFFGTLPRWLILSVSLKWLFDDYVDFLVRQLVRIKANISQWFTVLLLLFLLRLYIIPSCCVSNIHSLLDFFLILITSILLCMQLHRWYSCCSLFKLLFFSLLLFIYFSMIISWAAETQRPWCWRNWPILLLLILVVLQLLSIFIKIL